MQFTTTALLTSLLASVSLASPASRRAAASVNTNVGSWTITSFTRTCDDADTACQYTFGIDTNNDGTPEQAVDYTLTGTAAHTLPQNGVTFGDFTITSAWNSQGFTVWSVVDNPDQLIAFPAYADSEIVNGQAISPNKAFAVQTLPL